MRKKTIGWEDLTLSDFDQIEEVFSSTPGDDLSFVFKATEVLYGLTPEEVNALPLSDFHQMSRQVSFLKTPPSFQAEPRKCYRLRDTTLRLSSPTNISAGQYIDITSLLRDGRSDLARLLTTMLIPDGATYGVGYDINELRSLVYSEFPWAEAQRIVFFFLRKFTTWSRITLNFSTVATRVALMMERDPAKRSALRRAMAAIKGQRRSLMRGFGST